MKSWTIPSGFWRKSLENQVFSLGNSNFALPLILVKKSKSLFNRAQGLLKAEGCTHKSFSEDMVQYVGEELKRYKELSETTEIGKKMKDIGDK